MKGALAEYFNLFEENRRTKFVVAAVAVASLLSVGSVTTNASAEPGGGAVGAARVFRSIERAQRPTRTSERGECAHRAAAATRELRVRPESTHASDSVVAHAAAEKPRAEKPVVETFAHGSMQSAGSARDSVASRAETRTVTAASTSVTLHDVAPVSPVRVADAGRVAGAAKRGEPETVAHRFQDVAFCTPGEAECRAEDFWLKADLILRGLWQPTARDLETMSRVLATELSHRTK